MLGSPESHRFGWHVRSLRRARGLTQEVLAERCSLSVDTIRRLEGGSFSPSLRTLVKLTSGLKLSLRSFFFGYELGDEISPELAVVLELIVGRTATEIDMAMRCLRALFAELDGLKKKI